MTQKELVLAYVREFGSIIPAKMAGSIYKGQMFGSETSKRCRELRHDKKLISKDDGKFERFYIPPRVYETVEKINVMSPFRIEEKAKINSLF